MAEVALKYLRLDQVWLLVSPQNPLKPTVGMAPVAERLASAQAIIGRNPRLRAMNLEQVLATRYTSQLLERLRTRFPLVRFVWIMGEDNLGQISRWNRWERIFHQAPVAVIARGTSQRRTALVEKAAKKMSRYRVKRVSGLVLRKGLAWAYVRVRLHPASASEIRRKTRGEIAHD